MIPASREVNFSVMMGLCKHVLHGNEMLDEWQTSVLVLIFKGKRNVRNCNSYRGLKLLEHTVEIVKKVLERRIRELVNVDAMQFDFMRGRVVTDALFVVRRMQEDFKVKKKRLYTCFVVNEKAFDRVSYLIWQRLLYHMLD